MNVPVCCVANLQSCLCLSFKKMISFHSIIFLFVLNTCVAYPFQTVFWREADFHHVHLRQVYRQKNKDFQLALLDIRSGNGTSQRVKNLVTTCSFALDDRPDLEIPSGIKPTILYCTNRNVDRENYDNLAKLQGQGKTFKARDSTSLSGEVSQAGQDTVIRLLSRNTFFNDCPAGRSIVLKIGAQVMLLQNLDLKKGLVNGSRGVVESFKLVPVVKSIINGEEELIGPNDRINFRDLVPWRNSNLDKGLILVGKFGRSLNLKDIRLCVSSTMSVR